LALRSSTVTKSTALRKSTRNTVAFRRQLHVPSGPTIFDDVPPYSTVYVSIRVSHIADLR
jgi:hypothetical protein